MSRQYRKIREGLGLSQVEMGIAAGVSTPLVSRLESGRLRWADLQSRTRRGLAAAYGLDQLTGEPLPAQEPAPASSPAA